MKVLSHPHWKSYNPSISLWLEVKFNESLDWYRFHNLYRERVLW